MDNKDPMLEQTLGGYRIVRKIAQGGMGAVYEAVHSSLGRRAAVKVLLRELLAQAEAADRFFNEAIAISKVTHPCLVTIYEHGTSPEPDSQAYIVMEYLDGENLRARAEKHYLGGSSLELMRQLASALTATHKKRIIHRDLKPDNIMLVRDDTIPGGVRAKILDFGIAKLLPGNSSEDSVGDDRRSVKTRTGALIGTPAYMSPEQCRAAGPPDEKTDVYSLGTIFFEILYGEPPFLTESAGELYALHMFAPPPDLRQRIRNIDARLGTLVNRMLIKKPADRPSMEEVLTELQAVTSTGLTDGGIDARPSAAQDSRGHRESNDALQAIGSTSSIIRRQLGSTTTTTFGSSGEQQMPDVPARRGQKVLAAMGGAAVVALVGGFTLILLMRSKPVPVQPLAPLKPAAVTAPATNPPPPPVPPPTTPTSPTVETTKPAVKSTPTNPAQTVTTVPPRKEKNPRKSGHGSKGEKVQVELWK